MRIWHETLIPKLCQKHLCGVWREALGCYKIITENKQGYRNHPATKEFKNRPSALMQRLSLIRQEMLNRGYNPKELPTGIFSDHAGKATPWQTLEEQIAVLKTKGCACKV